MSKSDKNKTDHVIDTESLTLLGSAPGDLIADGDAMAALKLKVMQRIDEHTQDFYTIRADDGDWSEIAPKLYKKVLSRDVANNLESYLLRAEPGAVAPGHQHDADELCLVLEGDFHINGLHLVSGDYHFAAKGSHHSEAWTDNGTLLYLQGSAA